MNGLSFVSRVTFAALCASGLVACVTDANRCVSGYVYSSEYDACLALDAGTDAASPSGTADAGAPETGAPDSASDAAVTSGEGGATSDLGATCNADTDCSGKASYCLKSPADPFAPGYCTVSNCTAGSCTAPWECCTCAASAISALQALPPVCVAQGDQPTLVSFGCTCQ